jgi:hypothetical protein
MQRKVELYLFIFGIIGWITGQLMWVFVGTKLYYVAVALFITILVYIIHSNTPKDWKRAISRIGLFICFNNLADELFFDPTSFSYNEIFTALIYTIYPWIKYKRLRNGLN